MTNKCKECSCDCHKSSQQEENDRLFRQAMREQDRLHKEAVKRRQDNCEHLAGGLGETQSSRTSIVWHYPDDRVSHNEAELPAPTSGPGFDKLAIGICLECQRMFRPEDSDYITWRSLPSMCTSSHSGREELMTDEDYAEVRKNGFGNYDPEVLWARHFKPQTLSLDDLPTEVIDLLYAEQLTRWKKTRGY